MVPALFELPSQSELTPVGVEGGSEAQAKIIEIDLQKHDFNLHPVHVTFIVKSKTRPYSQFIASFAQFFELVSLCM